MAILKTRFQLGRDIKNKIKRLNHRGTEVTEEKTTLFVNRATGAINNI